ncbi:hypothetical protein RZS08_64295, partial [Arthrospira platensis SPKY1]|nr:hypothetical protein [Arthrospira platensis SPKY1]
MGQSISNDKLTQMYASHFAEILQNIKVEKSYGYQVYEAGLYLSERISLQLFGRGGRQTAPRTEQTIIALDVDHDAIAAKAFAEIGT